MKGKVFPQGYALKPNSDYNFYPYISDNGDRDKYIFLTFIPVPAVRFTFPFNLDFPSGQLAILHSKIVPHFSYIYPCPRCPFYISFQPGLSLRTACNFAQQNRSTFLLHLFARTIEKNKGISFKKRSAFINAKLTHNSAFLIHSQIIPIPVRSLLQLLLRNLQCLHQPGS